MKLIKVNSDSLRIADLGNLKIAFSYKTPIAIMLNDSVFITEEKFSKTTSIHKNDIQKLWGKQSQYCGIDKNTFQSLKNTILFDIENLLNNQSELIKSLDNLK